MEPNTMDPHCALPPLADSSLVQDNFGQKEPPTCANCTNPATYVCADGLNPPTYTNESTLGPLPSLYCSAECQAAKWPFHKAHCEKLHNRVRLARTAELLKGMVLAIQRHTYQPIDSVIVRGDFILLDKPDYWDWLPGIDEDVLAALDAGIAERVLLKNACHVTEMFLSGFVKRVVEYTGNSLQCAKLMCMPSRHAVLSKWNAHPAPTMHWVTHVITPSGEAWTIDPTGSQFGDNYTQIIRPTREDTTSMSRVLGTRNSHSCNFYGTLYSHIQTVEGGAATRDLEDGTTRVQRKLSYEEVESTGRFRALVVLGGLGRSLEQMVSWWEDYYGADIWELVEGTAEAFQAKKSDLLCHLENRIMTYMRDADTDEMMNERSAEWTAWKTMDMSRRAEA